MALAGPATNLGLAIAAALLLRFGYEWHVFAAPYGFTMSTLAVAPAGGIADLAARILSIFLSLNLLLCLFNMLPLPPLDGSKVAVGLLPPVSSQLR